MSVGYKHRNQVRIGFLCKAELANTLDKKAKEKGVAMTELIRQACLEYVTRP